MYLKTLTIGTWTRSKHLSWSVLVKLLGATMRDWTDQSHGKMLPHHGSCDLCVDCMSLTALQALMFYFFLSLKIPTVSQTRSQQR